jgi:hypothetical protein
VVFDVAAAAAASTEAEFHLFAASLHFLWSHSGGTWNENDFLPVGSESGKLEGKCNSLLCVANCLPPSPATYTAPIY